MPDPSQKLTLVTGASGFVGNNVVRHLLDQGRRVRAMATSNLKSLHGLDVEIVPGDIRSLQDVRKAVAGTHSVYHLAGIVPLNSDPRNETLLQDINVGGAKNVAAACMENGVRRLVHFSSIHALSHVPQDQPIDESRGPADDLKFHRGYDLSKAAGEREVLLAVSNGLDAVIINPVGILGPDDHKPSPAGQMLLQLAGRQLPGLVRSGYHWVDVRDVAAGAMLAEEKGRCGERYILSGQFVSFRTMARWVSEETGARPPLINSPVWLARLVAPLVERMSRLAGVEPLFTTDTIKIIAFQNDVQTNKAHDELGFTARPMRESIKEATHWLLNHQAKLAGATVHRLEPADSTA